MNKKTSKIKEKDIRPFAEKHPRWNLIIGFILAIIILIGVVYGIYFLVIIFRKGLFYTIEWISSITSKMDAVVIVALITGTVSITGIVFSSIISKVIEYKQKRHEYLYQKREYPYADFISVVYKLQESVKGKTEYSEDEMLTDMYKFSKKLTLWGSNRVIKKWIKFRDTSNKTNVETNSLFEMEEIMYQMRKDMGLRKMGKGKLLAFFINDIKQSIKEIEK